MSEGATLTPIHSTQSGFGGFSVGGLVDARKKRRSRGDRRRTLAESIPGLRSQDLEELMLDALEHVSNGERRAGGDSDCLSWCIVMLRFRSCFAANCVGLKQRLVLATGQSIIVDLHGDVIWYPCSQTSLSGILWNEWNLIIINTHEQGVSP
eukprot:767844-Hanusia_phi.AAC.2